MQGRVNVRPKRRRARRVMRFSRGSPGGGVAGRCSSRTTRTIRWRRFFSICCVARDRRGWRAWRWKARGRSGGGRCGSSDRCWPSGGRRSTIISKGTASTGARTSPTPIPRMPRATVCARKSSLCSNARWARGGYPRRRGNLPVGIAGGGWATVVANFARCVGGSTPRPAAPDPARVVIGAGGAKRGLPRGRTCPLVAR